MSASNLETVLAQRGYVSATVPKPFRNDRGQSRAPDIRDPAEDHGHSSGKRSILPAELLCLGANYGRTRLEGEVWALCSAFPDQLLRAQSHKRLLPRQRARAKLPEAHRSILHCRLRRAPTVLLQPVV